MDILRASRQAGFAYVMMLVALVIVGILAEVASVSTERMMKAEREAELLFRGQAYRNAIKSYYAVAGKYPRSLEELTKDPRSGHKRHLRMLYQDPVGTGEAKEWVLVRGPDGGIAGVASHSRAEPMKKANFPPGLEHFADAGSHAEWVFEYAPAKPSGFQAAARPPAPARPNK